MSVERTAQVAAYQFDTRRLPFMTVQRDLHEYTLRLKVAARLAGATGAGPESSVQEH